MTTTPTSPSLVAGGDAEPIAMGPRQPWWRRQPGGRLDRPVSGDPTIVDLQRAVRERIERRGFRIEAEDIERGPLGRMVGVSAEFSCRKTRRRWWAAFDRDLLETLATDRPATVALIDRQIESVAR